MSQLNNYLKNIIDSEEILHDIAVCGEVTNFKGVNNGNLYFSLKDESSEIACSGFGNGFRYLSVVKNGEKVVVVGSISFWAKAGKINLNVKHVENFGKGELELRMIMLKEKLKSFGYFDKENKKPLPEVIHKVGVVTSETGAVIHDICKIISRRNPFIKIILYPCIVQGDKAAKTIKEGIEFFDGYDVDVIVVARGGGSDEELMCYNDEALAKAIFLAKTPIVSAVGHQVDYTICDLVADIRAATPSEAAEIVAKDVLSEFIYLSEKFKSCANNQIKKVDGYNREIRGYKRLFREKIKIFFKEKENLLGNYSERIEKFNPIFILKRGYSKVLVDGKTAKYENIAVDDKLDVVMDGGKIKVLVLNKEDK